jgi:hypothetical protein
MKNVFFYSRMIILFAIAVNILYVSKAQGTVIKAGSVTFKKHIISKIFVSEGVTTGEVNNDGGTDILAGNYW